MAAEIHNDALPVEAIAETVPEAIPDVLAAEAVKAASEPEAFVPAGDGGISVAPPDPHMQHGHIHPDDAANKA